VRRNSSTLRTSATSIWGTQQVNLYEGARYDGVFAMWYGKGPGVDRCGDVFKHANHAGSSKHGGVLVLAGDDHGAKSSTLPHQSDHMLAAAMIPVLYPSSVQEILDLGLHGWAMSRYSGCWVGFKCVADTVESTASVEVDPTRTEIVIPCAGRIRSSPPRPGCTTARSTRCCTMRAPTA
jgi:indolepyruvate ferredoxin oxidoreductase